jgi:hypothetical protein
MSDRGEYRSFYVAVADDPDVHAMSDRAWRVLTMLKFTLPATGIGVVYAAQLAERCGCTPKQLDAALAELERPKPGEELGWIVRDRNVVWLVNGLRYEPTLSADNAKKHRPFVHRLVAQLGDKPDVVRRFKAYYAEWFPEGNPRGTGGESVPEPKANDTLSVGYPKDNDRSSKHCTDLSCPDHPTPHENKGDADAPPVLLVEPAAPVRTWADDVVACLDLWQERKGVTHRDRFFRAFKPLFDRPAGEAPPYPLPVVLDALKWAIAVRNHPSRRHVKFSPETFVADLGQHVAFLRLDMERRMAFLPLQGAA